MFDAVSGHRIESIVTAKENGWRMIRASRRRLLQTAGAALALPASGARRRHRNRYQFLLPGRGWRTDHQDHRRLRR